MDMSYEQCLINQIFSVQHKFDNVLGEMISNIFNLYDIDGDGNLDYEDYISFVSDLMYISILMNRMKPGQYTLNNVLKFVKWTAKNIASNLFVGNVHYLPYDMFSKRIISALTEHYTSTSTTSQMHFASLLPEFMNFFNYYVQISERRGWPSILSISANETTRPPSELISTAVSEIAEQPVIEAPTQPITVEESIQEQVATEMVTEQVIAEQQTPAQPRDIHFNMFSQFDMDENEEPEFPTPELPPEIPHELEVKEGIVIKLSEKGYDMIEGDLNINNYIFDNPGENIAFRIGETYFLTNRTIIKTMVNIGEKENAIFFGCQCEIKDDWTRIETWARLDQVVISDIPYFNVQHIGLPVRYVLLKDILALLKSDYNCFYIERPDPPEYIASFVSDNILNHARGSMSGVHCQDGQRDIIYRIKKFKPRFTF
uniref:EF-hand domain-containing protein n=1 Tax=viral metagenome TaxID=1070528 RepID=A0A6C0HBB0_9ZZZZ